MQNDVLGPLKRDPESCARFPFRIDVKKMWKPYAIAEILELEIPALAHQNDGLIFTPVGDPYVAGTCERLLKWKPSEMNSVDFKLVIVPESPNVDENSSGKGGAKARNRLELHVATSRDQHRFFTLHSPDDKGIAKVADGAIIECQYVPGERYNWKFMRQRDDKRTANNERVVDKIIASIKDNVTAKELISHIPAIRRAWKAREALSQQQHGRQRGAAEAAQAADQPSAPKRPKAAESEH